jgi:hypothetical protein
VAFLDYQPEIARAIRALLDRTPHLQGLVTGAGERQQSAPAP